MVLANVNNAITCLGRARTGISAIGGTLPVKLSRFIVSDNVITSTHLRVTDQIRTGAGILARCRAKPLTLQSHHIASG